MTRLLLLVTFPIVILHLFLRSAASCFPTLIDSWPLWRIEVYAGGLMILAIAGRAFLPISRRPGTLEMIGSTSVRAALLLGLVLLLPLPWFSWQEPSEVQLVVAFGLVATLPILWLLRSHGDRQRAASAYWIPAFLAGGFFFSVGLIGQQMVINSKRYLLDPLAPVGLMLIVLSLLSLPGHPSGIPDLARRLSLHAGRFMISVSLLAICFLPLVFGDDSLIGEWFNADLPMHIFLGGVISLFLAYLMVHVGQGSIIRLLIIISFLIGHSVLTIGLAGPDTVLGIHVSAGIRVAGAGIVALSLGIALHGLLARRRCSGGGEGRGSSWRPAETRLDPSHPC